MSRALPLRLTAWLVLFFATAAMLSAECGGNDVIDSTDASTDATFDRNAFDTLSDASLAEQPGDTSSPEFQRPDAGDADSGIDAADSSRDAAEAGDAETGSADASDTDARNPDAADGDGGFVLLPPVLGTAKTYAVVAGMTITNGGASAIVGDIGISPGSALVGFPPGLITGTTHLGDAVAMQAEADMKTAYNDLAGRPCPHNMTSVDLGGKTLPPGVYCFMSSGAQMVGNLMLDGQGDPNAVWIFQMASTLTIANNLSTIMINSGNACNVYWQVGSSATIGIGAQFKGNILAEASITLNTGASISPGRALTHTASVTMDTTVISNAGCP